MKITKFTSVVTSSIVLYLVKKVQLKLQYRKNLVDVVAERDMRGRHGKQPTIAQEICDKIYVHTSV